MLSAANVNTRITAQHLFIFEFTYLSAFNCSSQRFVRHWSKQVKRGMNLYEDSQSAVHFQATNTVVGHIRRFLQMPRGNTSKASADIDSHIYVM